ncbi:MAG TPA: hypothetical protein VF067_04390, partial [Sphingomicrobium sp.]
RLGHIGSTDWKQVSQFSAFVAGGDNAGNVSVDLGHFADPREWRDAAIEVIVRSAQPGIADRMFESFGWAAKDDFAKDLMSMENAGWTYTFPPDMGRGTWRALPCSVGMKVRVNHRIVATGLASVIQPKGEANDRAGVVVVKFPVVMAVPNALPQYSDIRGPTAAR